MKTILFSGVVIAGLILLGCNASFAPVGVPVFPRTNSIIPFANGTRWVYTYSAYDTAGTLINPNRLDLHIAITDEYGVKDDGSVVRLDYSNTHITFPDYAYQYEQERQGKGYLLVYRSLYPLETRGVYIIGEYTDTTVRLYPQEQLWLAYPAPAGKSWTFKTDPLRDSTATATVEAVATNARTYRIATDSTAGIAIVDSCYCYKQTRLDTVNYLFFNEHIGEICHQQYIAGKLRDTYILTSYSPGGAWAE
jgi:hypothetical protein